MLSSTVNSPEAAGAQDFYASQIGKKHSPSNGGAAIYLLAG